MNPLAAHHIAWLNGRLDRDETWLRTRLADGFQVHHIDGNHENNAPENLMLVYGPDHMLLHGMNVRQKIRSVSTKGKRGSRSLAVYAKRLRKLTDQHWEARAAADNLVFRALERKSFLSTPLSLRKRFQLSR